ncbi:MAG: response regulator transcription factor [Candidatus Magasanikbacteria bacterium]|nr:response regulator transcription factor [Candidatus Magasanikbacteria bacterium]
MTILIIEDEKDIIKFLKPGLEAECFAVDVAEDGEKGLLCALSKEYDVIILDNNLPKKSGQEVCEELRANKKTTPIIMLSVLSDVDKKVELLNTGADDYLTKPFSFQELLARIRSLLRRPKKIEDEILRIDDLELDSRRNTVKRGGEEISLTRKQFMLLEYLMRNAGMVLTRGMIMEHVWEMDADPFSNTIETHILSLRKKIKNANKPREFIQTVPGRGYKLEA